MEGTAADPTLSISVGVHPKSFSPTVAEDHREDHFFIENWFGTINAYVLLNSQCRGKYFFLSRSHLRLIRTSHLEVKTKQNKISLLNAIACNSFKFKCGHFSAQNHKSLHQCKNNRGNSLVWPKSARFKKSTLAVSVWLNEWVVCRICVEYLLFPWQMWAMSQHSDEEVWCFIWQSRFFFSFICDRVILENAVCSTMHPK